MNGLEESLVQVEALIEDKANGKKVPIPTSTLNDFVVHCKANIASAKSHLADERKREEEANTERELQRLASEAQRKEEALRLELQREEERRKQEEMDRRVSRWLVSFERSNTKSKHFSFAPALCFGGRCCIVFVLGRQARHGRRPRIC